MIVAALVLYVAGVVVVFGVRSWLHHRSTGSSGLHGISGPVFSPGWIGGVLLAQSGMGTSWRIGVDPSERTALVTSGSFALLRNLVFTAMLAAQLGMLLAVPSWLSAIAFAALLTAVELQVRAVEESYLAGVHGAAYTDYAARVGRFLPGVGHSFSRRQLSSTASP